MFAHIFALVLTLFIISYTFVKCNKIVKIIAVFYCRSAKKNPEPCMHGSGAL